METWLNLLMVNLLFIYSREKSYLLTEAGDQSVIAFLRSPGMLNYFWGFRPPKLQHRRVNYMW
jgi:hypothetical protein